MKLNKRKVFITAVIVCLVAILSFGTLAWFTDSDEVTNRFMTATSDSDTPSTVFNVDIYETVKNDETGSVQQVIGENTKGGEYVYNSVLPGDTLVKAPVVKNTGKYAQYVRVVVTVSDATYWNTVFARDTLTLEDLFVVSNDFNDKWDREMDETVVDTVNDTMTFVYYYKDVLDPTETAEFFEKIIVPESLDQTDMITGLGTDGFSIELVAEAIQSANTGDTAQDAFENF